MTSSRRSTANPDAELRDATEQAFNLKTLTWEAPEALQAEELEAAFVYKCPDGDAFETHQLDQTGLVIVGPVAWQDRLQSASLADLADFPWIWTSHKCPYFGVSQSLYSEMDCEPVKAVITDQEAAILHMVADGVGLSIMSETEAVSAANKGQLYIVGSRIGNLNLSLIYLKKRAQDPFVKAILSSIAKAWQISDLSAPPREREAEGIV